VCLRTLTAEGREVDIAVNGAIAGKMLDEVDYDLCLIDLKKPIMNGKQLYQVIVEKHQKLIGGVIFTTGERADVSTKHFLESAGRPSLSKPFTTDELQNTVQETLNQQARTNSGC
jgi:DNA-binding response OmpR family regulator